MKNAPGLTTGGVEGSDGGSVLVPADSDASPEPAASAWSAASDSASASAMARRSSSSIFSLTLRAS